MGDDVVSGISFESLDRAVCIVQEHRRVRRVTVLPKDVGFFAEFSG